MLDEAEIRAEIARLEYEESSYPNYAKLANLYTIQARMQGETQSRKEIANYSGETSPQVETRMVGEYGDSDFLRAVARKDPGKAWTIIDELMDTLALVNRKVYDSVLQKMQRA